MTSLRIKDFIKKVPSSQIVYIVASLHFHELRRRKLLDRYIENFILCKEAGYTIYAQEVAHPTYVNEVNHMRKYFATKGIAVIFNPYMGIYKGREYPDAYTAEEIKIFGLESSLEKKNIFQLFIGASRAKCKVNVLLPVSADNK